MAQKKSPEVFISYSRKDSELTKRVCDILKRCGIPYFLDTKSINWGAHVNTDVKAALANRKAIVVIVSPSSLKSQWVAYEIGHAVALGKKILPLLTHPDLDVPAFIHDLKKIGGRVVISDYRGLFNH